MAPQSTTIPSSGPDRIPPFCNTKYTTTLMTMNAIVKIAVRSVEMLSLSGNTRELSRERLSGGRAARARIEDAPLQGRHDVVRHGGRVDHPLERQAVGERERRDRPGFVVQRPAAGRELGELRAQASVAVRERGVQLRIASGLRPELDREQQEARVTFVRRLLGERGDLVLRALMRGEQPADRVDADVDDLVEQREEEA